MKDSTIDVIYKHPNQIFVKIDAAETLLISDEKKQINGTEIYECLKYKKDKHYSLNDLKIYKDINTDYQTYLTEIHEIFNTILKSI